MWNARVETCSPAFHISICRRTSSCITDIKCKCKSNVKCACGSLFTCISHFHLQENKFLHNWYNIKMQVKCEMRVWELVHLHFIMCGKSLTCTLKNLTYHIIIYIRPDNVMLSSRSNLGNVKIYFEEVFQSNFNV